MSEIDVVVLPSPGLGRRDRGRDHELAVGTVARADRGSRARPSPGRRRTARAPPARMPGRRGDVGDRRQHRPPGRSRARTSSGGTSDSRSRSVRASASGTSHRARPRRWSDVTDAAEADTGAMADPEPCAATSRRVRVRRDPRTAPVRAARRARDRGADGDPRARPRPRGGARRGDDADARRRLRARRRVPVHRGPDPARGRAARRLLRRRRRRGAAVQRGHGRRSREPFDPDASCTGTSSRRRPAACAARRRSTTSRCGAPPSPPGPTVAARASIVALPGPAARRRSGCSTGRAGCTRPGCSRPTASSSRVREDVGRHNAVDKVIGERLLAGAVPLAERVAAGVGAGLVRDRAEGGARRDPVVSAVGAPSSLAVEAADRLGDDAGRVRPRRPAATSTRTPSA